MHSMTTRRKLKSVQEDDDTLKNSKRSRLGTNGGKGKEKATSTADYLSDEGSNKVETNNGQSTRTSRGRTHMNRLTIQRRQGIRKEVQFDSNGRPVGKVASELQSYIGVLAREKVKITYDTWKKVPNDVKELIWESINFAFIVAPSWKIECLKSANEKWKQFKSALTTNFVFTRCHDPELLNMPPNEYGIPQADWSQFVISRMSKDFKKKSKLQSERSQRNKYPHRLSRKGYAQFEQEMGDELCGDVEVKRAVLWKKGRANKKGEYEGDELKTTIGNIDKCIKLRNEGKLKLKGVEEDVLTVALDSKEHPGRVRAIGSHVTPSVYFNVLNGNALRTDLLLAQRKELEAMAKNSEQDRQIETLEADLLLAQQKELEAMAKYSELDRRIEKLEAAVFKMSANAVDMDENGSSVNAESSIKFAEIHPAGNLSNEEKSNHDDLMFVDTFDALQGKPVALMLEPDTNVVAYGTVVSINIENQLLHGVPMSNNCVCVVIDHIIDGLAPLPIPITGECHRIVDAIGTHVAWPVHLIRMQAKKPRRDIPKKEPTLQASIMPRSLHMLYCYCKVALQGGRGLALNLAYDVFGSDCMINVHIDDIIPFCQLRPISSNCIVVYICHLFKKMKTENKIEKFRFVNPHSLGQMLGKGQDKKWLHDQMENRSRLLADRLIGTSIGQLVLVPVNVGFHWILTIIDPHNENVYLLDPLSHRNRFEEWKHVVNLALKLFTVDQRKNDRKQPLWEVIKAPLQPDGDQCGYFIMRYMRQIIEEYTIVENTPLQSIFTKKEYSREDIDEVRKEWSECLQDYVQE